MLSCSILCQASDDQHCCQAFVNMCSTLGVQAEFDPSTHTRMQQGTGSCVTGKSFGFKMPGHLLGQDANKEVDQHTFAYGRHDALICSEASLRAHSLYRWHSQVHHAYT